MALLSGWVRAGLDASFVVDPAARALSSPHHIVDSVGAVPAQFAPEAVIIAVKPQLAAAVLPGMGYRFPDALFLSIMAGQTVASLRQGSGASAWVRAMPNLPASIGRGVTGAFASSAVTASQHKLADRLLAAVGRVTWLADEALLDAVTAVSGSGPAYVFLLAEALEAAGIKAGLPAATARLLARETVVGAGALLVASEDEARTMREAVTSKAGTTERALSVLMRRGGLPDLIDEAVRA